MSIQPVRFGHIPPASALAIRTSKSLAIFPKQVLKNSLFEHAVALELDLPIEDGNDDRE
jgi:hypothetical protein